MLSNTFNGNRRMLLRTRKAPVFFREMHLRTGGGDVGRGMGQGTGRRG